MNKKRKRKHASCWVSTQTKWSTTADVIRQMRATTTELDLKVGTVTPLNCLCVLTGGYHLRRFLTIPQQSGWLVLLANQLTKTSTTISVFSKWSPTLTSNWPKLNLVWNVFFSTIFSLLLRALPQGRMLLLPFFSLCRKETWLLTFSNVIINTGLWLIYLYYLEHKPLPVKSNSSQWILRNEKRVLRWAQCRHSWEAVS